MSHLLRASDIERIRIPDKLPVFPLPNVILFPGIDLPLYIFELRYRKLIADCMNHDKFMAVSLLKKGWEEKKEPVPSHDVVGVGYVRASFENPDGTSHILLKGIRRAQIIRYTQFEPYRIAKIRELPDQIEDRTELNRLAAKLRKLLIQKLRYTSDHPQDRILFPREFENPVTLSHLATFFTETTPYLKQDLLETSNCNCRMKHLIELFQEELYPPTGNN